MAVTYESPLRLSVVLLADLPVPGLPPDAIEDAPAPTDSPRRIQKRPGYNCLEFAINPAVDAILATGSGDYAVYKYWPEPKAWLPEGPRGATPTTFDFGSIPEGIVPIRISTERNEGNFALVLVSSGGVTIDGERAEALVQEQQR